MDEDDSIPEPILNLRKKSAATHMRNFDSSGEERANNDRSGEERKRPHEENGNGENVSKLLCQEVGVASNEDPPARERPAVRILVSVPSMLLSTSYYVHSLTLLQNKRTGIGHNASRSALHAPLSFMAMDL